MRQAFILVIIYLVAGACGTPGRDQGLTERDSVDLVMKNDPALVEDGIHVLTGLKAEEGYKLVWSNCTPCHSARLLTQNRATREGWQSMIRWMQATQNLWDLGPNEEKIIDYLATYYAPEGKGRRKPLTEIEWYKLEE